MTVSEKQIYRMKTLGHIDKCMMTFLFPFFSQAGITISHAPTKQS